MEIVRKPLTDKELLLRMLCMTEHDFDLDRAKIELEPAKFFWRAVCAQADAKGPVAGPALIDRWAQRMGDAYGWTP